MSIFGVSIYIRKYGNFFLGIHLVLVVVVVFHNFQVLFLNKVLDNLVVADFIMVLLHFQEATPFQVVPHFKEATPFQVVPHFKEATPFQVVPHFKEAMPFQVVPHFKEAMHFQVVPHFQEATPFQVVLPLDLLYLLQAFLQDRWEVHLDKALVFLQALLALVCSLNHLLLHSFLDNLLLPIKIILVVVLMVDLDHVVHLVIAQSLVVVTDQVHPQPVVMTLLVEVHLSVLLSIHMLIFNLSQMCHQYHLELVLLLFLPNDLFGSITSNVFFFYCFQGRGIPVYLPTNKGILI